MCKECSEELKKNISDFCKDKPDMKFQVCNTCDRNLPVHDYFYSKEPRRKYGYNYKCKECASKKGIYSFIKIFNPWYTNVNELYKNYRKMSITQLEKYYNKQYKTITEVLKKNKLYISKIEILEDLTEDEVLFMYNSVLNNEVERINNGIFTTKNSDKYIKIIIKHLINNILKWNREDIINNYNGKILNDYKIIVSKSLNGYNYFEVLSLSFPEFDIKPWELKASSSGCNYWKNKDNINNALDWFKNKLLIDKNINNINEAKHCGFRKLLEEYSLSGMCAEVYNSIYTDLFKEVYNDIVNYDLVMELNYHFDINNKNIPRNKEGVLYRVTDKYDELDDRGKTLINEIIKFCENENSFPYEKELTSDRGYISRSQFYKYFKTESFDSVYEYILPIDSYAGVSRKRSLVIKPKTATCYKCNNEFPFTEEYFTKSTWSNKFDLQYQCKECRSFECIKRNYEKKGILFNNITDISPEKWFDYIIEGTIDRIPKQIKNDENIVKIVRHIMFNYMKTKTKEDIIKNFTYNNLSKFKIYSYIKDFGGRYNSANITFPEFKNEWTQKDFNIISSYDGNEFDSRQERDVYEFIKLNDNFKNIIPINRQRKVGKYVFNLGDEYEYDRFCPDYVVETIDISGKTFKLQKPIIIEFYGLYSEKETKSMFNFYRKKTKIKEEFYKSRDDIYYIGIYPKDLKNNFKGVSEKLASFLLRKNILVA